MSHHVKPFLKWAGGKYRLLNRLLEVIPPGKRLVEPFGGAGVVSINAPFQHSLLADTNHDLIILYQQLQQEGEAFIQYCASFFTPQSNHADYYYRKRTEFNSCPHPRERAALFLYLNRHGFNGLCRYNQKGGYNVPFGTYTQPYFPEKEMRFFCQKSANITFAHQPFEQTFLMAEPGDVFYCDPPYAPLPDQKNFTHYTHQHFSEASQQLLGELARIAASQGHTVIISNHDTPATREYYEGSLMESFSVRRTISCQERRMVPELLAVFSPTS